MAFGINIKEVKDQLKTSFDEMMTILREMNATLTAILGELRTSRGAPQ